MSRFVGTAGSQLDQLQQQLGRRGTLLDPSQANPAAQAGHLPPTTVDSVDSHTSVLSASPEDDFSFIPTTQERPSTRSDAGSSDHNTTESFSTNSVEWNSPMPDPKVLQHRHEQEPLLRKRPKRQETIRPPVAGGSPPASSFKLDTMSGVFIPVVLSIWGVLVFLRFGFIIGQTGVLGTLLLLCVGYFITTTTTLSISAISTNGTVRSGGPYFMISRSLGPEFGGSIGLIFYIGTVMGGAMNVFGFVEPLMANFGSTNGTLLRLLPEGKWHNFMYGSIMLILCTTICLLGSKLFAKASKILAFILAFSTLSVFVSFAFRPAFVDEALSVYYSGPSMETLRANLWPRFTYDAVGSAPGFINESFRTVFGVLFPACTGILAGASMSGDLANPSRSIPKGTLSGVGATFITYAAVALLLGSAVARTTFYADLSVLQDIALFPPFVTAGVLATATFSTLSAIIGASKVLQAISKDNLLPILSPFSKGTKKDNEPIVAVIFTYCLCQVLLLAGDINAIAPFVTMCSLLTFGVINLACFLLKAGSAPNFRPTFQYFRATTALAGGIACFIVMFVVDAYAAAVASAIMVAIFGAIHYVSPPKSWGDVTQSLIYHQVRKYLLRLDSRKEHVKFWRPQILLLVNNPRTSYGLIVFCNALKKGALYVVGHIIKGEFTSQITELRRQQASWLRYVDVVHIKAFVSVTIAETEKLGARNLILGSGLGGMRPNIVVMGSFDLKGYTSSKSSFQGTLPDGQSAVGDSSVTNELPGSLPTDGMKCESPIGILDYSSVTIELPGSLPTDGMKCESPIGILDYMSIIEDSLALDKAVAIAHGFGSLENPVDTKIGKNGQKKYIDLWPIQMTLPGGGANFDTYTMVLQLGCVLQMVKQWKRGHKLRVVVFVEKEADAKEERRRVQELLDTLRIRAELVVLWLEREIELYSELLRAEVEDLSNDSGSAGDQVESFETNVWAKEETANLSKRNLGKEAEAAGEDDFPGSSWEPNGSESPRMVPPRPFRSNTLPPEASDSTSYRSPQKPFPPARPNARRSATMYPTRTDSLFASNIRINIPLPKPDVLVRSDWSDESDDEEEEEEEEEDEEYADAASTVRFSGVGRYGALESIDENSASQQMGGRSEDATSQGSSYGTMLPLSSNSGHKEEIQPAATMNSLSSCSSSSTLAAQESTDAQIETDFNVLPSTAQNKIINRLIRRFSSKANGTAMVFTALPAPEPGASENVLKAEKWLNDLDALIGGLDVPSMCIHGKGMTVTTNL